MGQVQTIPSKPVSVHHCLGKTTLSNKVAKGTLVRLMKKKDIMVIDNNSEHNIDIDIANLPLRQRSKSSKSKVVLSGVGTR